MKQQSKQKQNPNSKSQSRNHHCLSNYRDLRRRWRTPRIERNKTPRSSDIKTNRRWRTNRRRRGFARPEKENDAKNLLETFIAPPPPYLHLEMKLWIKRERKMDDRSEAVSERGKLLPFREKKKFELHATAHYLHQSRHVHYSRINTR
jgi:hypothetical protein